MARDVRQPFRDAWEQAIRADGTVAGTALLVALVAATYGDRDGTNIFATVDRLASDCGKSPAQIKRAVAEVIGAGYLVRVRRGTRAGNGETSPSAYALALPSQRLMDEPESARSTAHGRALETVSTAHSGSLYGSFRGSLGLMGEPLPVVTRLTRDADCRGCDDVGWRITTAGEPLAPATKCDHAGTNRYPAAAASEQATPPTTTALPKEHSA